MKSSFITDFERPVRNIRKALEEKLTKDHLKAVILGMSGGIDSLACAVLALPICHKLKIPLIANSISIESNKPDEIYRARENGIAFCHEFMEFDLTELYGHQIASISCRDRTILGKDKAAKIRRGNVKARMRMISLFDTAANRGGLVLSTDNFTEKLLGFWTLHGDVGNYGMIQNMWKTEVFSMMDYFKDCFSISLELTSENSPYTPQVAAKIIDETIKADCTDGLDVSATDLDQILPNWKTNYENTRTGYNAVDIILMDLDSTDNNEVLKRYKDTQFKREDPYNIPREVILKID